MLAACNVYHMRTTQEVSGPKKKVINFLFSLEKFYFAVVTKIAIKQPTCIWYSNAKAMLVVVHSVILSFGYFIIWKKNKRFWYSCRCDGTCMLMARLVCVFKFKAGLCVVSAIQCLLYEAG